MADVLALRKLLAEEYGIHSNRELCDALKRVTVDIGVFVTPMQKSIGVSENAQIGGVNDVQHMS